MGNDLDGFAEVVAATLSFDNLGVNFSSRQVVVFGQVDVEEAFVIPQVKVNFSPVVEDEHFSVLKRRHGASIAVEVGVDLDGCHSQASAFEQDANATRSDSFSES